MKGRFFVWTCQCGWFVGLVLVLGFTCLAQRADVPDGATRAASAAGSTSEEIRQARKAVEELDFSRAETLLDNLLKVEPKHAEANLLLGRVLYLQGRYDEAIDQLNGVALPPGSSELLKAKIKLLLGEAYSKEESENLAAENFEEAELIAQDLLEKGQEFKRVWRDARAGLEFLDWIAYRTERLTFHYPRFSIIRGQVPQFADKVEKALDAALKLLARPEEAELDMKIDFYIYNGEQHGRDVLGRPPGFGDPITKTIHAPYTDPPGKHLMSVVLPYIAKKTGRHWPRRTLLSESILEAIGAKMTAGAPGAAGPAQADAARRNQRSAEEAAALLENGKLPPLHELLKEATKPLDEERLEAPPRELAVAIASFTQFLAERYGQQKLRELYFKTDEIHDALQEVYLKPLETLGEEWRKHVRTGDPKRFEKALLFLQLSTSYLKMELFDLAAEALEESLSYDPTSIPTYFDLIALYRKMHRLDAAIDAAKRAKAVAERPEEAEKLIAELRQEKADFNAEESKGGTEDEGELPLGVKLVRWSVEKGRPRDEKGPRFGDGNPPIAPLLCRTADGDVACFHTRGAREIAGFSAKDGAELWTFSPPDFPEPEKKRAPAFGYNLGGMASDGKRIFAFYNKWEYIRRRVRRTAMLVGCDVFEIDPSNGKETRRFSLEQPLLSEPSNIVSANGGRAMMVCFISGARGEGRDEICALDLRTGEVKWSQKIPTFALRGYTGAVPFLNQRAAFIGDQDGRFYGYDLLSGEKVLEFEAKAPIYASACGTEDIVLVGSSGGVLYCLASQTGRLLWRLQTGEAIVGEIRVIDGLVSFATRGNRLYCVSANDGRIVWRREERKAADRRLYTSPKAKVLVTMNGSRDFFGDETPIVSLLRIADGKVRWRHEIEYNAAVCLGKDVVLVSYGDVYEDEVSKAICLNVTPSPPTTEMKAAKIFKAAEKEREEEHPQLSEALLEKCVELAPEANHYLRALADAYYDNKKFSKAAEVFRRLIDRDPDNAEEYEERLEDCEQELVEDLQGNE